MKRGFWVSKRGISAIVATVLIILITVAAVTIIWVAIIPMISEGFGAVDVNTRVDIVTTKGYTVYDSATGLAMIQIKRSAGDTEMENVRITLNFEGSSYSSIVPAPEPNQEITYTFDLNIGGYPAPQSVSVAPIFIVGNSEKEGVASLNVEIGEGNIVDIPTVLYDLGKNYRATSVPACIDAVDCASPNQCQNLPGTCNGGSCGYGNKVAGTSCNDGNAGTDFDVCNGAGVCAGVPPAGLSPCIDADTDGWCLESSGSCDASGGLCLSGYGDCNDALGSEYISYPANTYYYDTDGDGFGTTFISTAFCSDEVHMGAVLVPGDCMGTNAAVNPDALENAATGSTCDDGLNNDCDASFDCSEGGNDCDSYSTCSTTPLTSCGTISVSGDYYLEAVDWGSAGSNCFTITADDVHIDGNGEYLSISGGGRAFFLDGTSSNYVTGFTLTDITIEVSPSSYGVYADYADDYVISNSNFSMLPPSGTSSYGFYGFYARDGLLYGNRFTLTGSNSNSYGVYLTTGANGNTIQFNYFSGLYSGLYLSGGASSNQIKDNTVTSSNYNIFIYSGSNTYRRNSFCSGISYDIYASSTSYCTNSIFPSAASGDGNACTIQRYCSGACVISC